MSLLDTIESAAETIGSKAADLIHGGTDGVSKLAGESVDLLLKGGSTLASGVTSAAETLGGGAMTALEKGAKFAFNTTAGAAGDLTAALPGIALTAGMANLGFGTFENLNSGDRLKNNSKSSIESLIPDASKIIASAAGTRLSSDAAADKSAKPTNVDAIFNYVSAYQWQNILKGSDKSVTGKDNTQLPSDIKINGTQHIHTQADGTVTTQEGDKTRIAHANGHTILRDAKSGLDGLVVDGKLVFSEDTKNHTEQWLTPQGAKVVKTSDNKYQLFDRNGNLIAERGVDAVQNEVSQVETATLTNGERLVRHLGGRMAASLRSHIPTSGSEWAVYSDGVTRTLKDGMLVGMSQNKDAIAKTGNYTVVRDGSDHKYYIIDGSNARKEVDPTHLDGSTPESVKKALKILQTLDSGAKMEIGDGTYITIQNGKVIGGTDKAGPATSDAASSQAAPDANGTTGDATAKPAQQLVTTDGQVTTARLRGGVTDTYNFQTHEEKVTDTQSGQQMIAIQDDKVTTDYVTTTSQGTVDRTTGDQIAHDGSIKTTDGIQVAANNDIRFADGTEFNHNGNIILADGRTFNATGTLIGTAVGEQQAAQALATASGLAAAISAAASSGNVSMAEIAALQSAIANVSGLAGMYASSGNTEASSALDQAGTVLKGALADAQGQFNNKNSVRTLHAAYVHPTLQIVSGSDNSASYRQTA